MKNLYWNQFWCSVLIFFDILVHLTTLISIKNTTSEIVIHSRKQCITQKMLGCSLFSDKQCLAEYRHTNEQQQRFIMFLKKLLTELMLVSYSWDDLLPKPTKRQSQQAKKWKAATWVFCLLLLEMNNSMTNLLELKLWKFKNSYNLHVGIRILILTIWINIHCAYELLFKTNTWPHVTTFF